MSRLELALYIFAIGYLLLGNLLTVAVRPWETRDPFYLYPIYVLSLPVLYAWMAIQHFRGRKIG